MCGPKTKPEGQHGDVEAEAAGGEIVSLFHDGASELCLDIPRLKLLTTPVQHQVGSYPASCLGLGHNAAENLQLRKRLGKPGAPFGGIGLFDPQRASEPGEEDPVPKLTADAVKRTKLEEFRRCIEGSESFYFWSLQPIFNVHDRAVAAEILIRGRNGADAAPFEDLQAIMDPAAPGDVREVYGEWKATEMVDFAVKALRENEVLRKLSFISTNVWPADLCPKSPVFQGVARKLQALSEQDRQLLLRHLLIEIIEDQQHPEDILSYIDEWQKLGFHFAADDTIGEMAAKALGKQEQNFHIVQSLGDLLGRFWLVKVDMSWAGHLIFLSHPSVATRPALREEILKHARDEDEVHMAAGPGLRKLEVKHSVLLAEFAQWALEMIALGKRICIELTVRQEDENCALAIRRLKELGLDIFGQHQAFICFQGGPCGAKAFVPEQLAASATVFERAL